MSSKRLEPPPKSNAETSEGVPLVIDCRALEVREMVSVASPSTLDPSSVCQLAIFKVMAGMVMYSIDLVSFLKKERSNPREFTWRAIAFDSHVFEEDAGYPKATILPAEGELSYETDAPGFQKVIADDTAERFAPDTQLVCATDVVGMFVVETELTKREDRAGVHAAFARSFTHEPRDVRPNRRVVMPEYFDQVVRLELVGVDTTTPKEMVHQGRWPLKARIRAQVSVAELVKVQPKLTAVDLFVKASPVAADLEKG
jgi:hypothetical protein